MPLPEVLRDLFSLPTVAFVESAVMEYVQAVCCRLRGVSTKFDRYGNLLAHYVNGPRGPTPLVFTAHADHPGFVALGMESSGTLRAAFRGWVEPEYFVGAKVRFWSAGRWIKGKVVEITKVAPILGLSGRTGRPAEVLAEVRRPVQPNSPGMWDLPEAVLRGDRVLARGCDDIAGVAGLLALLQRLSRKRVRGEAYCLFTRAEEAGFVGAIAAAKAGIIPRKLPIIAIDMSKELPNARIGDGPILRVGDKSSVFTPALTAFCDRVAKGLAQRRPPGGRAGFAYQRKLMDGGTCESTAYMAYGYSATGICLALGNYHNMDMTRRKIASEYVSLRDWQRMVDWFEALVRDGQGYDGGDSSMRETLDQRFKTHLPLLKGSES